MAASTVLVVDDDPVIVKLLQVNFEMEGYDVLTASDGEEGLQRARSERPDIVLLDVMMPKMDGLQVAQALKADPDTAVIPVILLSAKVQAADVQIRLCQPVAKRAAPATRTLAEKTMRRTSSFRL